MTKKAPTAKKKKAPTAPFTIRQENSMPRTFIKLANGREWEMVEEIDAFNGNKMLHVCAPCGTEVSFDSKEDLKALCQGILQVLG